MSHFPLPLSLSILPPAMRVFHGDDATAVRAETCTSVTVTGGDFPGVYELGADSSSSEVFVGTDDSTHILQPVVFGERVLHVGKYGIMRCCRKERLPAVRENAPV